MKTRTQLKKAALIAGCCALSAQVFAATTIKWPTVAPEKSVWGAQMAKFAAAVEKHSEGDLNIEVFYGGVLGQDKDNIRQVQRGRMQAGSFSAAVLPTIAPETAVLAMPYVWSDAEEMGCALEGSLNDEFATILKDKGMHLLGWSLVGEMGFSSLEPVKAMADLKSANIRSIPSKASTDFWSEAGLVPHTIAPSDIAPALSTKRVTAAEGSMVFYVVTGENKIAPHWVQSKHVYIPAVFVVSNDTWDGLNDAQKSAMNEAMEEVSLSWFLPAMNGFFEKIKGMQSASGGSYSELSGADSDMLRGVADRTREGALEALGDDAQSLWTKVDAARQKCSG